MLNLAVQANQQKKGKLKCTDAVTNVFQDIEEQD